MICVLAAVINCDGKVPSDWKQSFIVCLYKGQGDVLEKCNYRCPSEQVTKSWKGLWTASSDSWCQLTISSLALSQAAVQQMQSLLSGTANKRLYMAVVDLEKAFDQVHRMVI